MKQVTKLFTALAVLAIVSAMSACTNSDKEPGNNEEGSQTPYKAIELTRSQQEVVKTTNRFAYRLLAESDSRDGNVIQSPLSVATMVAMLSNGAEGTTRDELLAVLGHADLDVLNSAYSLLGQRLPEADGRVDFNLSNSMWLNRDFQVRQEYAGRLKETFNAEVLNVDLFTTSGMDRINEWVKNATDGHMDKFLSDPLKCEVALVNAVYFNGKWKFPFDKTKTQSKVFQSSNGRYESIPMMTASYVKDGIEYAADDYAESIRLPYGNGSFYMQLVLPREGKTPEDIVTAYASGTVEEPVFETAPGTITMPKFEIESIYDMAGILRNLGITTAFGNDADYSLISNQGLKFKTMLHKALIEVDEDGSKASAATSVAEATGMNYVSLEFNRPFLFLIKERSTGVVAFSGIVRNL